MPVLSHAYSLMSRPQNTMWLPENLAAIQAFVQPAASRTGNRLWHQNSANEPSVMQDLLHGTVYLIIFNPSLTLPVLNDSSKLFCFLHAVIIKLCNVSRTIVQVDTKPYDDDDDDDDLETDEQTHARVAPRNSTHAPVGANRRRVVDNNADVIQLFVCLVFFPTWLCEHCITQF